MRDRVCFAKVAKALDSTALEAVLAAIRAAAHAHTAAGLPGVADCWAAVGDYLGGYSSESDVFAAFDAADAAARAFLYVSAGTAALTAPGPTAALLYANVALACWEPGGGSPLDIVRPS